MLPASLHFRYFTCFPDVLFQEFDPMIYKSFSGVENVIPHPIHTDLVLSTLSVDYTIYNNCACFQKVVKKKHNIFSRPLKL